MGVFELMTEFAVGVMYTVVTEREGTVSAADMAEGIEDIKDKMDGEDTEVTNPAEAKVVEAMAAEVTAVEMRVDADLS